MDKELHELLTKYKLVCEHVDLDHNQDISKQAVQSYVDNTIWRLFSRTELQNKALIFNNDQNRKNDKIRLDRLISTLFEFDKLKSSSEEFANQLHDWMVHIITIYLSIASSVEKKKILLYFMATSNISPWAIPLIQYKISKKSQINDYLQTITTIFTPKNENWVEDDYLLVLDQLAIEYNYNEIINYLNNDELPDVLFQSTRTLVNTLSSTIGYANQMPTLLKRISQSISQIIALLVQLIREKEDWHCQEQIDTLLCHLIYNFYDLKHWLLLPNIPFQVLSTEALWKSMIYMLRIKDNTHPSSLNDVLNDNLPNITRFHYELHDNHTQGYFLLTCLTNIATCIPQGVDNIEFANIPENVLSACIVSIISYTLFIAAFVNRDLRELFYKDVRDHLFTICQHHSFIISLLFRWTVEHISIMERMSLYLFHALPLSIWTILRDDLVLIHKLLTTKNQKVTQVQLIKYILSHLSYEYIADSVDRTPSKTQPWHSRKAPFLPYDIHEQIAYILLDACESTTTTTSQPRKSSILFPGKSPPEELSWAWSIAAKLKLYDCPVSPKATDTDRLLDIPFLKRTLSTPDSSYSALLVYISFMLSSTSRQFLRFQSNNGWLKLLVILKRSSPECILVAFSNIVPSFVYMHGDDFFNDNSLDDFLKHLVEFKPMQGNAVKNPRITGVDHIVGSHMWQAYLIDSTSNILGDDGFSYVDLMLHSWLQLAFRRTDWMWKSNYVCILDTLCKLAFILNRHQLVYEMLCEQQQQQIAKLETTTSSPRLARLLKVESHPSLLVGGWSLLKAASIRSPGVESKYPWFAFQVLIMETEMEKPIRDEMVHSQVTESAKGEYMAIYRWLQHILVLPVDHVLLPLYCQMFLSLYYQPFNDKCTMGNVFFNNSKKKGWIIKLRDYIAGVLTFYGQQISTVFTEALQPLFYDVWLWLGDNELLNMVDIQQLPSAYNISRLKTCYGLSKLPEYWMDVVNMEGLEQDFLNFSWEGSDKFRTRNGSSIGDTSTSSLIIDDQFSLSTSRMKLATDETTILPLPSVVINTPSPVRSSSLRK